MDRIKELILKQFITVEELKELEQSEYIKEIQDNSMSGLYYGYHWYTIITEVEINCNYEHDLYVK